MIDALNVASVEYLNGGAIAEWAWGEPRATQDLDLVVKIPIKPKKNELNMDYIEQWAARLGLSSVWKEMP